MPVSVALGTGCSGARHREAKGPDRLVDIRGIELQVEQVDCDGVGGVVDVKCGLAFSA